MGGPESPFERWFDELSVGDRFATRGRTVTEADLVAFSALTGDWHPQHADAEWAARSEFGARVAHGLLVLSYAVGLLPVDPERVLALRAFERVTFKAPVPIGTTISASGEVSELRALDAAVGLVKLRWSVTGGERAAVRLVSEALWRRAPAG